MILIKVIFKVSADKVEDAKAAFVFSQNLVTEEAGCISFRYYQDLEDPAVFFLFEEWETQEALEAHSENQKKPSSPKGPKWPEILGEPIAIRYQVASYGNLRD